MRNRALALTIIMGAACASTAIVHAEDASPRKEEFAEIKFSVEAREQDDFRYKNGNYVRWKKTTVFEGTVQLASTSDGNASSAAAVRVPTAKATAAMTQSIAECQKETDPVKMGQCFSRAVIATPGGQAAAKTQNGAGGSGDTTNPRIWRAVTCAGRTQVSGSGDGYDQSLLADPYYTFDIHADWTAVPTHAGSSSGCSAGAIVDTQSGTIQLYLKPAPNNIRTQRRFDNSRGLEEQPDMAFEELGSSQVTIDLETAPGARTFSGTWRPTKTGKPQDPAHKIETVVKYSFLRQ